MGNRDSLLPTQGGKGWGDNVSAQAAEARGERRRGAPAPHARASPPRPAAAAGLGQGVGWRALSATPSATVPVPGVSVRARKACSARGARPDTRATPPAPPRRERRAAVTRWHPTCTSCATLLRAGVGCALRSGLQPRTRAGRAGATRDEGRAPAGGIWAPRCRRRPSRPPRSLSTGRDTHDCICRHLCAGPVRQRRRQAPGARRRQAADW